MKKWFKALKWLHKYMGLFLVLYLSWMAATGILLNHPSLLKRASLPSCLTPPQYTIDNWGRSSLIDQVQSETGLIICGKAGVWRAPTQIQHGTTPPDSHAFAKNLPLFEPMMAGDFPAFDFDRKTYDLLLLSLPKANAGHSVGTPNTSHDGNSTQENPSRELVLAATEGGLFACDPQDARWHSWPVQVAPRKLLQHENKLWLFHDSGLLSLSIEELPVKAVHAPTQWRDVPLKRKAKTRVTLIDFFFHLHDGSIWGLPGRLLIDFAGALLLFLSLTAIYTWLFPKRLKQLTLRKEKPSKQSKWLFRFLLKHHIQLGALAVLPLLVLAGTGFFMRPPFIVALVGSDMDRALYPGPLSENPWDGKIQNALIDHSRNRLLLAADGIWAFALDDDGRPLGEAQVAPLAVPIFVMGPTVFECLDSGDLLIGSYSGLFRLPADGSPIQNALTLSRRLPQSTVRPAGIMVTGLGQSATGDLFVSTHRNGLQPLAGEKVLFQRMPAAMRATRLSLWNACFELHNGRFFKDFIGPFYILLTPTGALMLFLIVVTGLIAWLRRKYRQRP
jgi:hypothetical protein